MLIKHLRYINLIQVHVCIALLLPIAIKSAYVGLLIVSADYANTTADVRFGPSIRTQCVLIPLINDVVLEAPKQFRIKLAMVTPLPCIVLTPDTATIVINDDDGKWFIIGNWNTVS